MAREGARLPLVLDDNSLSPDFITDHNYHITKSAKKINHPTFQVQNEGADYQHSDGPHGCEVLSEYNKALGSPLPVPLQVIPGAALHSCFLYRN